MNSVVEATVTEAVTNLSDIGLLMFIKTTYPVSFIIFFLGSFGASLAGLAWRPYLKTQDKHILSLEREIERLS